MAEHPYGPEQKPRKHRLEAILLWLKGASFQRGQVNLATFFARRRDDLETPPIGCVLGHWAALGSSSTLSLEPIKFKEQVKSPILMAEVFSEYMRPQWQHFTLKYRAGQVEAYGESAVLLYLNLRKWDAHRLFYPAGANYEMRPPVEDLVVRLERMVRLG